MSITIGLYRGRESGHFWSWLLAWLDRTVYSHAAIVWGVDQGTAFVSESTWRGVHTLRREWRGELWDFWTVDRDADQVQAWFEDHEGAPYDWPGLLHFIWPRIKGLRGGYFCDEAVLAALGVRDPWRFGVAHTAALLDLIGTRVEK